MQKEGGYKKKKKKKEEKKRKTGQSERSPAFFSEFGLVLVTLANQRRGGPKP